MHLVSQQTLKGSSGIMCFSPQQLLAHIVRSMAFNLQLADHAARIQLSAASKYANSQKRSSHLPLVQTKRGRHTKAPVD